MQYSGGAGKLICYNCGLTIRCSNADELWDILGSDDFAFISYLGGVVSLFFNRDNGRGRRHNF